MSQPEGRLCAKIIKHVTASYPKAMLEKIHGSPMGRVTLDLRGSIDGIAVEIEVKMPGNEPSPRQFQRIRTLQAHNVITGWCTSVEEADAIIKAGLKEKKQWLKDLSSNRL